MAKPRSLAEAMLNIDRVLKYATQQRVLIGIPAEKAGRSDSAINNATLGYIHEYGAPEANIPARPFLGPGIEASEEMIAATLGAAAEKAITLAAMDGDVAGGKAAFEIGLNKVGLKAVSNIRNRINAGIAPPLSERTIYARMHRKKNRRKNADGVPLIDTSQLLRSITYVIKYR